MNLQKGGNPLVAFVALASSLYIFYLKICLVTLILEGVESAKMFFGDGNLPEM